MKRRRSTRVLALSIPAAIDDGPRRALFDMLPIDIILQHVLLPLTGTEHWLTIGIFCQTCQQFRACWPAMWQLVYEHDGRALFLHDEWAIAQYAARHGFVALLAWSSGVDGSFRWDICMQKAVKGGHVPIIDWLCSSSEFGDYLSGFRFWSLNPLARDLITMAARNNDVATLRCLYAHVVDPPPTDFRLYLCLAAAGALPALDFLTAGRRRGVVSDKNISVDVWNAIAALAAAFGQIHILYWMNEKRLPWKHTRTLACLAFWGDVELVKWARDEGCPWSPALYRMAIAGSYVATLCVQHSPMDTLPLLSFRILFSRRLTGTWSVGGRPLRDRLCAYTAQNKVVIECHRRPTDHMDILDYAYAQDCPVKTAGCIEHSLGIDAHMTLCKLFISVPIGPLSIDTYCAGLRQWLATRCLLF
jgi:hypothetical protein